MARKTTFTTYINTALAPNAEAGYAGLEKRALAAYGTITRAAQAASAASEAAGRVNTRGFNPQQHRQAEQAQSRVSQSSRRLAQDQRMVGDSAEQAARKQTLFVKSLDTTARALTVAQGPLGPIAGKLNALKNIFEELTGIQLGVAAGAGAALTLGRYAQAYTDTKNRLVPLFESQSQVNRAFEDVVSIANRARVALDPVADLYSKLTLAGPNLGRSQEQIGRLVELATKAAKISGGATQTQEAGLYQFAQGLGSGTLAGEELKSIKENTLFLAQQIAAGFKNADGSIGTTIDKLKELGAKGELTGNAVADALERSSVRIDAAYERLPGTVGSSMTKLSNNFTALIGNIDEATRLTRIFAGGISLLADNLGGLATLAALFAARWGGIHFDGLLTARRETKELATQIARADKAQAAFSATQRESAKSALTALRAQRSELITYMRDLRTRQAFEIAAVRSLEGAAASGTATKRRLYEPELAAAREKLRYTTQQLSTAEAQHAGVQQTMSRAMMQAQVHTAGMTAEKAKALTMTGRLQAAGSSLVGFLGGPWGIAFTIATAAVVFFTSRLSAAERAAQGLTSQQLALADAAYKSAHALDLSSAAAARSSRAKSEAATREAIVAAKESRADLAQKILKVSGSMGISNPNTAKVRAIAAQIAKGGDADSLYAQFDEIRQKDKQVQRASARGGLYALFTGTKTPIEDALATNRRNRSMLASNLENLKAAEKSVSEYSKPTAQGSSKKVGPVSTSGLRTAAQAEAIDAGTTALRAAGIRRKDALRQLDEEFGVKGGKIDPSKADAYKARAAEIERAYNSETAAARAASAGSRSANASKRKAEAAAHKAFMAEQRERKQTLRENAEDKLNRGMQALEDERPLLTTQAYLDARIKILKSYDDEINAIDSTKEKSAKASEQQLRDARAVGAARSEITKEFERNMQVSVLQLQGRDAEANALRRTLELVDRIGDAGREEYQRILDQERTYQRVNDALESRNRIIQTQLSVLDTARDGFEDFLVNLPGKSGGSFKSLFNDVMASINRVWARKITEKIFGGADEKLRQLIEGNNSVEGATQRFSSQVDKTVTTTGSLQTALADATQAVQMFTAALDRPPAGAAPTAGSVAVAQTLLGWGTGIGGAVSSGAGSFMDRMGDAVDSAMADLGAAVLGTAAGPIGDIVVNGGRAARSTSPAPPRGQVQSQAGIGATIFRSVGENLDKLFARFRKMDTAGTGANPNGAPAGFFTKMGATFGKAFEGAGTGAMASGFARALGIKQSSTGASIGGAIGSFIPGVGPILGGLIGGTIGGLFKKTPKANATITNSAVEFSGSGKLKQGLTSLGSGVQDSVSGIAEQLGGSVGDYSVAIRQKKKKIYVNGQRVADMEEAQRVAVLEAIKQGAVKGITQGAQALIRAGQDIERQLAKAVKFQSVFDELKSIKDPLGFAVERLNRDFEQLKTIFAEAGASAADYAALEELYGIKRADAITQATEAATGAIEQYLKDMVGSSESPLNRRDVYSNSRTEYEKFRADVEAGKRLSQDQLDDLLSSARAFQDASRTLNGSGESFYRDFEDIRALLTKARDNAGLTDVASLPASPFAQETAQAINASGAAAVAATNAQTQALLAALQQLAPSIAEELAGRGTSSSSLIGQLPGFVGSY